MKSRPWNSADADSALDGEPTSCSVEVFRRSPKLFAEFNLMHSPVSEQLHAEWNQPCEPVAMFWAKFPWGSPENLVAKGLSPKTIVSVIRDQTRDGPLLQPPECHEAIVPFILHWAIPQLNAMAHAIAAAGVQGAEFVRSLEEACKDVVDRIPSDLARARFEIKQSLEGEMGYLCREFLKGELSDLRRSKYLEQRGWHHFADPYATKQQRRAAADAYRLECRLQKVKLTRRMIMDEAERSAGAIWSDETKDKYWKSWLIDSERVPVGVDRAIREVLTLKPHLGGQP